jgi:hypothetical protein
MNTKDLVLIFCGEEALHQHWQGYTGSFDLALLKYNDYKYEDENSSKAKFVFEKAELKWNLFTEFLKSDSSGEFYTYDNYLFLDDDIRTTPQNIDKFFNIFKEYNFDLAQPGYDKHSYLTHEPTKKIDSAIYHTTSTVEIMSPAFSKRAIQYVMEDFFSVKTGHGYGLENVWSKKLHKRGGKSIFGGLIGVIDGLEFCHTRPVGGGDIYLEKFGNPYEGSAFFENKYHAPVCWETIDVVY